MSAQYDAIVIGADANGLAAALALAKAGRRTLLVERGEQVGGRSRPTEFAPGYWAAPLGLDADWVPPRLSRTLGVQAPELVHPTTPLSVAIDGTTVLRLDRDTDNAVSAIQRHSASDAARWPAFTDVTAALAEFLGRLYQLPAPDVDTTSPGEMLGLAGLAWQFRRLGRQRMTDLLRIMPMAVGELVGDWFETDALKAAVAAGGLQDIRQGPRSGGTAFVLLHHLVGAARGTVRGRGYWRAGPDAMVRALAAGAQQAGVEIRTGTDVRCIAVRDYGVHGIALADGEEITAASVLSSLDPAHTLLGLVEPTWLDPEFLLAVRNIKFRGATAYVLFGLDDLAGLDSLAGGNHSLEGWLSLTPRLDMLEQAFDATKYGEVSERLHVELTAPSVRWPDAAPDGKHVVVARVQFVPHGVACADLADRVTTTIGEFAPDFSSRVRHRAVLTPSDIAQQFGMTEGAASHGELTLDQILFMRPIPGWARYAMPFRGLYLCGAGTHPGPGIAGGAGWLAAQAALQTHVER